MPVWGQYVRAMPYHIIPFNTIPELVAIGALVDACPVLQVGHTCLRPNRHPSGSHFYIPHGPHGPHGAHGDPVSLVDISVSEREAIAANSSRAPYITLIAMEGI